MMVRAMLCVLAVSLVGIAYSEEAAPHNGGVTGTTTLPSTDVCGKLGGRIKRVVGGSDADPGIFPWMAALGYTSSRFSNILWKCAGSLVTDRHVVTAAQCVGSTDDLAVVRMGIRDLNDTIEDNGGTPTDYEVDSWIQYPGYNVAQKVNDIAIVRLKNKVTFSHLIQPICLPTLGDFRTKNFTGFEAYIAGWGVSNIVTGGAKSTHLQQAQILIWGQTECKTAYDTVMKGIIDPRMVCAADDGKDTCQGDSGGPLMIPYGPDSNYYLYGVASFGRHCADPNYPGVYTRVSEFTDWILQNLK